MALRILYLYINMTNVTGRQLFENNSITLTL